MSSSIEALRTHLRTLFPALTKPDAPSFLDNAAGTLVPLCVVNAVAEVLTTRGVVNALPGYKWGQQQQQVKNAAREATAIFVNAPEGGKEIVMGPSSTALSFRLAAALARQWSPGDAVIISGLEHECSASPWRDLTTNGGIEIRVWEPHWATGGHLHIEDLQALLADGKVKLLSLTVASNCFGLLSHNLAEASKVAHAAGAMIIVDAVAGAPHYLPNVARDDLDFLLFSPYKICAPHIGAMYVRHSLISTLDVPTLHFYPEDSPAKFEYGTAHYELLAGWLAALEYFACELGGKPPGQPLTRATLETAWEKVAELEAPVKKALVEGLLGIPGVKVYGDPSLEGRIGTVAFTVEGLGPDVVALRLGEMGCCVGNGHFYATLPNEALGLLEGGGVVRASISHYTSLGDVDVLIKGVKTLLGQ